MAFTVLTTHYGEAMATAMQQKHSYEMMLYLEYASSPSLPTEGDVTIGAAATATFTFSGTATLNSEIEILDTSGAQRTYQFKDSVTSGQADGTDGDGHPRILVDRGSSASDSASGLKAAVEHANGHNGTIVVTANSSAGVALFTQNVRGAAGNRPITLDQTSGVDFTTNTSPNPPSAFTSGTDTDHRAYYSGTVGIDYIRVDAAQYPTVVDSGHSGYNDNLITFTGFTSSGSSTGVRGTSIVTKQIYGAAVVMANTSNLITGADTPSTDLIIARTYFDSGDWSTVTASKGVAVQVGLNLVSADAAVPS